MSDYLVSVVIPVYNRADTIERAVKSVLTQTYKNIEVIIVDDGSTDGTLEILKRLEEEKIKVFTQNHKGANAARNFGIKKSKGEFISFQDSDDEWLPDKLEKQIVYMLKNRYEVCYCPFFFIEAEGSRIIPEHYEDKYIYETNVIEVLKRYNVISTQTLVISKNVIHDVGIFDEEMPRYQDYEYVIRIIQKKNIGYVNKPLVKVYRTGNSISNDERKRVDAEIKLLEKHSKFLDVEWYLKNKLEQDICSLKKRELNEMIDSINGILMNSLTNRIINVYKILNDILFDQYRLQKKSCKKEYQERIKRLCSCEFAIYGAGVVGKKIFYELFQKGLKPQCFLVTEEEKQDILYGIPVVPLAKWDGKSREVIIGVSLELQDELIKNLIKMGYVNYFRYSDDL